MLSSTTIKSLYSFTPEEEEILRGLHPMMKEHREEFSEEFSQYVRSHEGMVEYFHDEERIKHHKMQLGGWFMRLFNGVYDDAYIRNLGQVGKVHVDIKLDGHFVNAAMGMVRQFISEIIESRTTGERKDVTVKAVNKILDINLDVLTSSYRTAELKQYFLSYRVENKLVSWLERFTHGLNLVLALALGFVSLAVVGLFVFDASKIFTSGHIEDSIIAALGSLLIIWMMIELLDTEIQHLKGKKIPIKIFVGVVMVAFIRKVLIGSFQHTELVEFGSKVATLLVLGILYWLVTKSDRA